MIRKGVACRLKWVKIRRSVNENNDSWSRWKRKRQVDNDWWEGVMMKMITHVQKRYWWINENNNKWSGETSFFNVQSMTMKSVHGRRTCLSARREKRLWTLCREVWATNWNGAGSITHLSKNTKECRKLLCRSPFEEILNAVHIRSLEWKHKHLYVDEHSFIIKC